MDQRYVNRSTRACLVGNVRQLVTMTTPARALKDVGELTANVSERLS